MADRSVRIKSFRDLRVWQSTYHLSVHIYKVTSSFLLNMNSMAFLAKCKEHLSRFVLTSPKALEENLTRKMINFTLWPTDH